MPMEIVAVLLLFADLNACTGSQISYNTAASSPFILRGTAAGTAKAVSTSRDDHGKIADSTGTAKAVSTSRNDHGKIADSTGTAKAVSTSRDDHGKIADSPGTAKAVSTSRDDHGKIADSTGTAKAVSTSRDDHGKIADSTGTTKSVSTSRDDHGKIADSTGTAKAVSTSRDDHGKIADSTGTAKAVSTSRNDDGKIADSTGTAKAVSTSRNDDGKIADSTGTAKSVSTSRNDHGKIADSTGTAKAVSTSRDDHGKIADSTDNAKAVSTSRNDDGKIADSTGTAKAMSTSRNDYGKIADSTGTTKAVSTSRNDHGKIADSTGTTKAVSTSRNNHGKIADSTGTTKAVSTSRNDHGKIADSTGTTKAMSTSRNDHGKIADSTGTAMSTSRNDHGKIADSTGTAKAMSTSRNDHGQIADSTGTAKAVSTSRNDHGKIADSTGTTKAVSTSRNDHGKIADSTGTAKAVSTSRDDHGKIADSTGTAKAVSTSRDDHGQIADSTGTAKVVSTSRNDHGKIADSTGTAKSVSTSRNDHGKIADSTGTVKAVSTSRDDHGKIADSTDNAKVVSTSRNDHGHIAHSTDNAKAVSTSRNDHGQIAGYHTANVSSTTRQRSMADSSTENTSSAANPQNTTDRNSSVFQSAAELPAEDSTSAITGTEDACKKYVTVKLSDLEGVIAWSGSNRSPQCTWIVDTSHTVGVVLQFEEACLQLGTTAEDDDSVVVATTRGEVLRHVTGCLPVSPVLVPSPNISVTVTRHKKRSDTETTRDSAASDVSRFTLRYKAYPAVTLPPQLPSGQYNCSPPYVVPEALRCDMAEQCLGGEDERNSNCSYHSAECGGWQPYGELCLRFFFPKTAISPLAAESRCQLFDQQSALAALHDPEGKRLGVTVTSLSGYDDLIVGLRKKEPSGMYRFFWSWNFLNTREREGPDLSLQDPSLNCVTLRTKPVAHLHPVDCSIELRAGFACIKLRQGLESIKQLNTMSPDLAISYPTVSRHLHYPFLTKCLDGSFKLIFGKCPPIFAAKDADPVVAVQLKEPMTRFFECQSQTFVRYTLTCDGNNDCVDNTDETLCSLGQVYPRDLFFVCTETQEVFAIRNRCDGKEDCWDGSDETACITCSAHSSLYLTELGCLPESYAQRGVNNIATQSSGNGTVDENVSLRRIPTELTLAKNNRTSEMRVLTMDGYGAASLHDSHDGVCPETHHPCPGGLCIPTYLLINYEDDCPFPFQDDEKAAYSTLPCTGHYRCRRSNICLHPDHVCDGVYHCPFKDDERYCDLACPDVCVCEGLEYTCTHGFDPKHHPFVRYLDLSHSLVPVVEGLAGLTLLRFFNVSSCQLNDFTLIPMMSLIKVLDLSFNNLTTVRFNMLMLTHLNLSGNPLVQQLTADYMSAIFGMPREDRLLSLSLAQSGIHQISDTALHKFTKLMFLDVSGNGPVSFGKESMLGLMKLQTLRVDDQRLCCAHAALYPNTGLTCHAPVDELSSCSDLLRSSSLRVTLWLQATMAVTGNVGVFVFRVFRESRLTSSAFRVLVTHLCVSDFLMGVYMVIIGAADAGYSGQYLWKRDGWTVSDQCRAAGFLALLSSEVSAFIICLITLDRFLVLRFPFKRGLHLTSRSAMVVCGAVWGVGVVLATVPLLPFTQHWRFYGQIGICLPLPITRRQFPGQAYSVAVFIGLNFVLFLLIGAGQLSIFLAVQSTPAAGRTERRQQDMAIARRLFLIVLTDLCCWLPVGVMGLLAARGVAIPGELNVWTAVFVLPLNSALNPFLYTLNTLRERSKKRREENRMARMISKLRAELATWSEDKLEELGRLVQSLLKRASGCRHNQVEVNQTEPVQQSNSQGSTCRESANLE